MKNLFSLFIFILVFFSGYGFSFLITPQTLKANQQPIVIKGHAIRDSHGHFLGCDCPRNTATCYCIVPQ